MFHKSNSSNHILQPEIAPSAYPENSPKQDPPPLNLTPVELWENDGPSIKGFWIFKKNNQNRAGPKSVPSKRAGAGAPPLERSWSEPNSPTEPTGAGLTGREKSESKVNYITMAEKLLEESKVRFYGNMKPWEEFSERFKNLFANGRPAGGKLVKPHTPVHGAQVLAGSIVEDIQAALEAMDQEMLVDRSLISTTNLKENVQPLRTLTPEPWFDSSTIKPVNFDKVKKHKSIDPTGTWHGHSRTRNATVPNSILEFADPISKNGLGKVDQGKKNSTAEVDFFSPVQNRDAEKKEDRPNRKREGERAKGKERAKEVGRDNAPEKIYRDTSSSRELERGRRDRPSHHHYDSPLIENVLRPEPSRGRQISDPAIYTQSPYNRRASPDSLSPAVYTLAEDVEVRDGSSSIKIPDGRNFVGVGMPRAPTIVNYPDESAAYGSFSPSSPCAGPSIRTDPRIAGFVASPLSPVAEVPGAGDPTDAGHRRRRRSRSLGHELNGGEYQESSRPRAPRDPPRTRDKDKDILRKQENPRDKGRNRDRCDRDRGRETRKSKEQDRDRQRDKERGQEKVRGRDKDKEQHQDQGWEKGKDKDKEHGREKDQGSMRIKNLDGERDQEFQESGARRDKGRNRDGNKLRDRDRIKEKERDGGSKDNDKRRNRARDRERYRDRNHKGRERNYDHNRIGERLVNPPSALALPSAGSASLDAATNVPAACRDRPTPFGSAAPSGNAPTPPHSVPHIINQLGMSKDGPFPPNPISDSRFMEILTSPVPPMHFNLPEQS